MDNATSIKGLIQGMTGGEVQLYQGSVISTDPLHIQIANDSSLILSSTNTYVPQHLTNYTVQVSIAGSEISGATMTVNGALKTGDTVHLLSLFNGKQYYVLDRV